MDEQIIESDSLDLKKLNASMRLWEAHRLILQKRAIDLNQVSAEWALGEMKKLTSPGARDDFEQLCKIGCTPHVLAAIVFLFHFGPRLEKFWEQIVGNRNKRKQTTRAVERAIEALDEVFSRITSIEDEDDRELIRETGHIPASELISELRFYSELLNFTQIFAAETQTRSLSDVMKYLLAGYVKRATGRFCDKNVSGLLAEIVGPFDFNEVAQRMWRSRNYQRLEAHFGKMADLLHVMGIAINPST